jgi:hypothetical protein
MDAAYIKNLTALVARLGSAWIDNAMIANLSATKLTIGDGTASIRMQKGAVASIRLDDGPGHPGDLEWLATDDIV